MCDQQSVYGRRRGEGWEVGNGLEGISVLPKKKAKMSKDFYLMPQKGRRACSQSCKQMRCIRAEHFQLVISTPYNRTPCIVY